MKRRDKICVLGLGYVGLTLSVTLADAGFQVVGVDISPTVVSALRKKKAYFFEQGLEELIKKHIGKSLHVFTEIPNDLCNCYIVAVGTPINQETKKPVYDYLTNTIRSIAAHMKKGDLVILRSTVPVGISRQLVLHLLEKESRLAGGKDFYFVFAPERTIEGRALLEQRTIPQIIGGINLESAKKAAKIFQAFNKKIVFLPDMEHAEMLKVIDNTYRDVTFAYANQIALICERLSLDMGCIHRVGNINYPRNRIPKPSPGVGGACLTKDPYLLSDLCRKVGVTDELIIAAREINEHMPVYLAQKLVSKLSTVGKKIYNAKIFIMGFAFKGYPETSDIRFSTTIDLLSQLSPFGGKIFAYDPVAYKEQIEKLGVKFCLPEEGFKGADAILVMNNHPSYQKLKIKKLLNSTNKPCIFMDCWSLFPKTEIEKMDGVIYGGIGTY